jgi:hypothetical protein
VIVLPSLLAAEAGGQKRFEVDAATLQEALTALPISDLLLDERGRLRGLVNVYVDGEDARDLGASLRPDAQIRLVASIAGGR